MDLLADLYFSGFSISDLKKKSVVSDVALCVLYMRVLHVDLHSVLSEYKSFLCHLIICTDSLNIK